VVLKTSSTNKNKKCFLGFVILRILKGLWSTKIIKLGISLNNQLETFDLVIMDISNLKNIPEEWCIGMHTLIHKFISSDLALFQSFKKNCGRPTQIRSEF
tara:strand:+ start:345 stop:644 length:300 start_codon:yes stop_codon:yes gene_type:complete